MRLLIFTTLLTSLSLNLMSQEENQQQVPGTNVYMEVPEGFTLSENFKGFNKSSDPYSMIMLTEFPGPFREISKGFIEETMVPKGMTLLLKEERNVGKDDGFYIEMLHEAAGEIFKKAVLIYGNNNKTTIINGMCLSEDENTYTSLSQSIKNAYINTELLIDNRTELGFSVNEEGLDLQFISVVANGMLFNRDGLSPTESSDKLNIIVDKSYADVEIVNRMDFCLERLGQFRGSFQFDEEIGINEIEIDNISGLTLKAQSEEGEILEQIILFIPEGGYYIFAAFYQGEGSKANEDFMQLINTFKQNQ